MHRYNEFVPLLYQETTFHFTESKAVSIFADSVFLQSLDSIRSMYIDWNIKEVHLESSRAKWMGIWETFITERHTRSA